MNTKKRLRFDLLSNDEIDKLLIEVYSKEQEGVDLALLTVHPGLEVLRDWVRNGFSDAILEKAELSPGMQKWIKMAWAEQKKFAQYIKIDS